MLPPSPGDPFREEKPVGIMELRKRIQAAGISDIATTQVLQFLVSKGLPVNELESFIEEAKNRGLSIISHATSSGIVNDEDMLTITATVYNLEVVKLSEVDVDADLAEEMISDEQANRWRVLPYSRNAGGELLVAIGDAGDAELRERIIKTLPKERIKFMIALVSELDLYIAEVYQTTTTSILEAAEAVNASPSAAVGQKFTVRGSDPIIRLVDEIVESAYMAKASDIHIVPGESSTEIRFRVDGELRLVDTLAKRSTEQVIAQIKIRTGTMKPEERRIPQDGRITITTATGHQLELRVVSLPSIYGDVITMRLLDQRSATTPLETLGMSPLNLERYLKAIDRPYGSALIVGPTGSGKSTTLYSSINRIKTPKKNFITIEAPVEYRLDGITQTDVSRSASISGDSKQQHMTFASALRAILRSDPDVIMVGEIRDTETAKTAINAALTGHFLFSTLHTNTAATTLQRLQELGVERFLVAEAVSVIVAQRLVKRPCKHCRIKYDIDAETLKGFQASKWMIEDATRKGSVEIYKANPKGCFHCQHDGYSGRTGIHEVVPMTEPLKRAINEGKSQEDLEILIRSQGIGSLRDDAFSKIATGETTVEEMLRVVGLEYLEEDIAGTLMTEPDEDQ